MYPDEHCVVIAGAGVAGAVAACELLRLGWGVHLVERPGRSASAIEALAPRAIRAFADLGLAQALERAGAVVGSGFENAWEFPGEMRIIEGPWLYVERDAMALSLRREAISRGARTVTQARLPPLKLASAAEQEYEWFTPGLPQRSFAAIDATGRAARWIGVTQRRDLKVATLFSGPGSGFMRPGRIIRTPTGWAYALFHPQLTTVGIVETPPSSCAEPGVPRAIALALDLAEPESFHLTQRRPAHAQWARAAIQGRLLAIGDSAFACEPLAGQGLYFALASASAAAAVIANVSDGGSESVAAQYYCELIAGARRRHLAQLDGLTSPPPPPSEMVEPCETLAFCGEVIAAGVRRGDKIIEEPCLRLRDGGLVRWLGEFDLLELPAILASPCSSAVLAEALQARGLQGPRIEHLLRWSVDHEILCCLPR
jgi:hypothetical protein